MARNKLSHFLLLLSYFATSIETDKQTEWPLLQYDSGILFHSAWKKSVEYTKGLQWLLKKSTKKQFFLEKRFGMNLCSLPCLCCSIPRWNVYSGVGEVYFILKTTSNLRSFYCYRDKRIKILLQRGETFT